MVFNALRRMDMRGIVGLVVVIILVVVILSLLGVI